MTLFLDGSKQGLNQEVVALIGRCAFNSVLLIVSSSFFGSHMSSPPIPFKTYIRWGKRSNIGKFISTIVYELDAKYKIRVRKINTDGAEAEIQGSSPNHPKSYVRNFAEMVCEGIPGGTSKSALTFVVAEQSGDCDTKILFTSPSSSHISRFDLYCFLFMLFVSLHTGLLP